MSNLRTRLALAAGLLAGAAFAIPYPAYYFPTGAQVGTKVRVVVGGVAMGGVKGAYITGDGVKVTRIDVAPGFPRAVGKGQPQWVMEWLYDILEGKLPKEKMHRELPEAALAENSDWHECIWWPYLDERDDLEMQIIARDRFTPENYPQATPALDQLMLLDVEVAPDATPGRRDIVVYDGHSASAPHSFFITKEPHVQEKFFVIPPRQSWYHKRLPHDLHLPTEIKPQQLPVYIDGQAWPGETDSYILRLEQGQNLVCALTGRELLPFLGDAVPGWFNPEMRLYDSRGNQVAEADDFYYLPDPVLTYKVPEDGFYRLDVCDNLYRGRSDFTYFVHCYAAPTDRPPYTPQERAFECFPQPASHEIPKPSPKLTFKKGTIDYPGRVDRHYIDIKTPGDTWKFELFSRRCGSPLDGVVRLYGPMGSLPLSAATRCAEWDDSPNRLYVLKNVGDDEKPIIKTNMTYVGSVTQFETDPIGSWKFTEPGRYCVTVSDRAGSGGEHYDYTLVMSKLEPSFEVYAAQSAFVSHPGGRAASFKASVLRRDGFKGPITFDSTDDFEVSGEFTDDNAECEEIDVTVTSLKSDWSGIRAVQLTASGYLPSGEQVRVRVTPCDPGEQAFAYTHYLPQKSFFFCVPGESVRFVNPHPLPHLPNSKAEGGAATDDAATDAVKKGGEGKSVVKKTSTHSKGKACLDCHDKKKKGKNHTKGKACITCHEGR